MKGIDKLRNKLPDYQGRKIRVFVAIAFVVFVSSLMFQLFADSLPRLFRNLEFLQIIAPLTPIIGFSYSLIFAQFQLILRDQNQGLVPNTI